MSLLPQLAHSLRQVVEQRLRQWTRPENHGLVLNAALDLTRCRSELVMENALLHQQLIVLERQIRRPQLNWRDRTLTFSWQATGLASHAVCERFLGSLRRECLDHFVILNERHLHRLVKEYKATFDHARPH